MNRPIQLFLNVALQTKNIHAAVIYCSLLYELYANKSSQTIYNVWTARHQILS